MYQLFGRTLSPLVMFIFCAMINIATAGKDGIIRGVVIDFVTKEPLLGANIYIKDLKIGTAADKDGKFQLRLNTPIETTVVISFVGYEKKEIKIKLAEGEDKELTIYLNPGATMMAEVMVIGSKIKETVFSSTNSVSVVTEEEIKTTNYATTADILREEPGILVQKTTHGHGAPVIRGLIGRHVLLLYNGIRLNKPTFRMGGNQYLDTINPESLNRVEVTRGPTSVLYGSDAIGGTVNLVTERYESEGGKFRIYPELKFGYSSADDSKNASVFVKGSRNFLSFSGNLLYKKVNNLDPGGDEKRQVPTGWDELDGDLNLFFEPTEMHTVEFNYLNINQKKVPRYDKYVTGDFQQYIYDPQKRRLYALTYTYSPPLSWLHQMKWNVSLQNEHEGRIKQKAGSSKISTDDDKINTLGTYINFSSVLGGKHWLNWGAEYYRDKVRSGTISDSSGVISIEPRGAYPDNSIFNSFGTFIQDEYIINKQLDVKAGARYSYVSYESPLGAPFGTLKDNLSDLTGFTSISYKPTSSTNIVASYSRGFRAPNFNDTVVLKESSSGIDAPSPGLKPEVSHNVELGLKIENEKTRGGWFVFYNRMNGLIDRRLGTYQGLEFFDRNGNRQLDPGEEPIYQKFNVGKAEIYGTEMHASYRLNVFTLSGQMFYTYGENITEKEPMSRIPPLMGQIGLRWNKSENWWIEANTRFAAKQDRLSQRDIDDTRIPDGGTPGYKTFNVKGMYKIPSGRIVIVFENIFDELYKTHGSGIYFPGRHIAVSYQITPFIPGK